MNISGLPEVTSLEDNDYLVIQSGELTGKILKSNLEFTQPVTPQIITSINPPDNPEVGLIWNQIDSNNSLLETWYGSFVEDALEWVSDIKCTSVAQPYAFSLNNAQPRGHQLDVPLQEYDIFLEKWNLSSQIPNTILSTQSVVYRLQLVTATSTNVFSASNISLITISNITSNKMFKSSNVLGLKYTKEIQNNQTFRILAEAVNVNTNCVFNSTLFYRYIY